MIINIKNFNDFFEVLIRYMAQLAHNMNDDGANNLKLAQDKNPLL